MARRLAFLFCFIYVFPLLGCDAPGPNVQAPPEKVPKQDIIVASIDDRKITQKEFDNYLERIKKLQVPQDPVQLKSLKREYLLRYIERIIFLKEAENNGIAVTDEEILDDVGKIMRDYPDDFSKKEKLDWVNDLAWKEDARAQLTIKKLIRQEVLDKINITDNDLKKYYDAHKKNFNQKKMVRIRQIVVDNEKEANEIRKKLLPGTNFAKIAKKLSRSPDHEKGGDLGFFARGQMPVEFDAAAFSLKKKKQISQVFRSDYGYHIFQLVDKKRAKKLKFSEVKDKIRKILREKREKEEFKLWFSKLKERVSIKINASFL